MEEGYYVDLCESLHDLADDMENFMYWKHNRKQIIERVRKLAGWDTREGKK